MTRISIVLGKDVALFVPRWAGAMVERLRKRAKALALRMIRAQQCIALFARIMDIPHADECHGVSATFEHEGYDFLLWYNAKGKAWEVNFASTPTTTPRRRRKPDLAKPAKTKRARKQRPRAPARPQSVRRPRRRAMKRLAHKMYETVRSSFCRIERAASGVVKLLTKYGRIEAFARRALGHCVRLVQHAEAGAAAFRTNWAELLARKNALRNFAELASPGADGMRLERIIWGAEFGLPMRFSTYFPPRPYWDWAAMFGEREESERFVT